MLNLKEIKFDGDIATAKVEPWSTEDDSFYIKVDTAHEEILEVTGTDDTESVDLFAPKARLVLSYIIKKKIIDKGKKAPENFVYATH